MMSTWGLKRIWPGPRAKPKRGRYVKRASERDSEQTWRLTGTGVADVQPTVVLFGDGAGWEAIEDGSGRDMLLLPHWMETRRGLGRLRPQIFRRSSGGSCSKES